MQQLAEAIAPCLPRWPPATNLKHSQAIARAVLVSGLVVPTSDVLRLAQQWDDEDRQDGRRLSVRTRELRALTQQETR